MKVIRNVNLRSIVLLVLVFIVFTYSFTSWIDTDFGWHYRLGEIYSKVGIPQTDPFSFTAPDYPYVDHEWFVSFLYYHMYELFGYGGLGVLQAAIATVTPLVAFAALKKSEARYWLVPTMLAWGSFALRGGVRPHVFSWFLMAALIRIFYDNKNWDRLRWFLPPLMLVWVNFHGSFVIGFGLTTLLILLKFYKKQRVSAPDSLVLFLSFIGTLITPYGFRTWQVIVRHMTLGAEAKKIIIEWWPAIFSPEMPFFALIAFTSVIMYVCKKRVYLWEIVIAAGAFFSGLYSGKYIPYSSILVAPILARQFSLLLMRAKKVPRGVSRFNNFYSILTVVAFVAFLLSFRSGFKSVSVFRETALYSKQAAEYLNNEANANNVFTTSELAGYLIWKAPDKKYFMDGRMDVFVWDAPEGQSSNMVKTYMDIFCGRKSLQEEFVKYNVDTVVLPKKSPFVTSSNSSEYLGRYIEKYLISIGFFGSYACADPINIYDRVSELNWNKTYEDELSIIYLRP